MGLKRYQLLALRSKLLEISGNSFAMCTVWFFGLFFVKVLVINCISLQCQSQIYQTNEFSANPSVIISKHIKLFPFVDYKVNSTANQNAILAQKKHQKWNTLSQLIIIWSEASTNATKWEKVYDHLSSFRIIFLWFFRSPSMQESSVLRCVLAISITVRCWQRQSACCSLSALLCVCVCVFLVHQFAIITIRQKYKNVPNGLVKK